MKQLIFVSLDWKASSRLRAIAHLDSPLITENLSGRCRSEFTARITTHQPNNDDIAPDEVVIIGNRNFLKWVCFRCPDGCGEVLRLSLQQQHRPRWSVTVDWLARPTLHPSVWLHDGCRCHFWLKQGVIRWVKD